MAVEDVAMQMNRTTIMLPEKLKSRAAEEASNRGVSLGELIRKALQELLTDPLDFEGDSFFADTARFTGDAPTDLAADHDRYLYDEP